MMKRLLILGVLAALAVAYIYYDERSKQLAQQQANDQVVAVTASPVIQKTVALQVKAVGTVQPYVTVSVKSQVSGQLLTIGFSAGQVVHKDDVLFVLDKQPFLVQLQKAQAELAHDEAQLANARLSLGRYEKLLKKNYVSKQDYDQMKANELSALALVQGDQATVASAQLNVKYCTIQSPLEGRAGDILIDKGNLITANTTPLVTINQINPIFVSFTVPEQNLLQIQRQNKQATSIPVQALVAQQIVEQGTLSFIDNAIDASTGNIILKATFANTDQRLWPGQFVQVVLPVATLKDALLVPAHAVQEGQQGSYVFVVKPDNTVAYRLVETGPLVPEGRVIRRGLQAGERVVTAGQLQLTDGAPIKVKS